MENDTLLPTFLESDDDDAVYDPSTRREMAEEALSKQRALPIICPLSLSQIRSIVEEEIARFVVQWDEKRRPTLEKRAWSMWRKQHRLKSKKLAAKKYGDELEEVKERIEKVRGEMEGMEWRSEDELRHICGNLKESVNRAEELKWSIDLLTGKRPARPLKEPVMEDAEKEEMMFVDGEMVEAAEDADDENDVDKLDEEEDFDEDGAQDGLDGFIVDDNDIALQFEKEDVQIVDEDGDKDVEMDDADTPKRPKRKLVRAANVDAFEGEGDANNDVDNEMDNGPVGGFNDDVHGEFGITDENEQVGETTVGEEVSTRPDTGMVGDKSNPPPDDEIFVHKSGVAPRITVNAPEIPRPSSLRMARSHSRESTALPTPPREDDNFIAQPLAEQALALSTEDEKLAPPPSAKQGSIALSVRLPSIKSEKERRPDVSAGAAPLDFDYDSDIPWAFGDREIAEFVQCSEASTSIATDYLVRAEGQVQRAIGLYFEDLEKGLMSTPPEPSVSEPSTSAPKIAKKEKSISRKAKRVVCLSDGEDESKSPQQELAQICGNPFKDILPRGKQLRFVNSLLASIRPSDLHSTLNEIATLATVRKIDPTYAFLPGETAENCDAYWKIYLAYTHDLFGATLSERLSNSKLHRIRSKENFEKFYDRLVGYVGVQPPPLNSTKDKLRRDDGGTASGQLSAPQESRSRLPKADKRPKKDKDGKSKAKTKAVKPITKSSEQRLQEQELKKLADRERNQRKKGNFITTTAEGDILVNPGKKISELAVVLHPRFANVMKPHQIEGVQFMWKQVCHSAAQLIINKDYHHNYRKRVSSRSYNGSWQNLAGHCSARDTLFTS